MLDNQDIDNILDIIDDANIKGKSSEYISDLKIKVRELKTKEKK